MEFKTLIIHEKDDYVVIELNNGKVNAINAQLTADLRDAFLHFGKDDNIKGLILSGRPNCFSAGLDIFALASGGMESARVFWINYHEAIRAMVQFRKPFVCAVTGYAPAGATTLILTADYRIMAKGDKHQVGMNEFNMSFQIPKLLGDIFIDYLGESKAWEMVQKAKLVNSDEALSLGLVNESVDVEDVLPRAEKHLKRLMQIQKPVYQNTKRNFRRGLLEIVNQKIDPMVEVVLEDLARPETQQLIQMFMASIKGGTK